MEMISGAVRWLTRKRAVLTDLRPPAASLAGRQCVSVNTRSSPMATGPYMCTTRRVACTGICEIKLSNTIVRTKDNR